MKKIGRYVINAELGRGAMGIVYRASDPTIDREVALKVLSISDAHEEGTHSPQEMFMREVRAAGRLAHPAIVVIYDAFDDHANQTSCIVMELVPGVTLEKILESGKPLTMEQFHSIIRQVADGLDFAHKNHVIHRDLKPANILVTDDGRAKITDFGIAKVLAREGVARTIGIMGTPSYMSPEQVKGGEVDARTDIFSLGIMIYTMLTGQKPFSGNTAAVMFKIVYEEPALPSTVNPQLTPGYDQMIKKCLAKDRNQRYASARELLDDMEDLQQGRPLRSFSGAKPSARPAPPPIPSAIARPAAPPAPTPSAPVSDKTLAMPIPGLIKEAAKLGSPPAQPPKPAPPAMPPPRVAPPPPRPQAPSPGNPWETRGPAEPPPSAPPAEHTVAMPIAGLMKSVSGSPTPPAAIAPPAPPQAPPPPSAPVSERTVAMPIAGLMKSVSGGAAPPPAAAPPPQAPPPPSAPVSERTVAMPIAGLMKSVSGSSPSSPAAAPPASPPSPPLPKPAVPASARPPAPPEARPLTGQTLPMRVPDFSELSSPPVAPPAAPLDSPQMERTLPRQVPDFSHLPPPAPPPPPRPAPVAPAPEYIPEMERTVPSPLPDYSPLPPAAGPVMTPPPPTYLPDASRAMQPLESPGTTASAPKSNLLPVVIGGFVVLLLLSVALIGYFTFHRAKTASAPPAQVAVQTPPVVTPPPVPTPEAVPTPPPAPVAAPTPPPTPVNAAAGATKKPVGRKQKQATTHVEAPAPPPPAPAPVVAAPTPVPVPAAPSPEELARAEAARLAKIPRIVQVSCNFGMKEAILIFSAGGNALFEESLKGKKMKGGFLGIKGSYQGTFSHTITVPPGVSDISIRVTSKDGSTDLTKAVKMPPPGGFVPTLAVEVDGEHLALSWKGAAAK